MPDEQEKYLSDLLDLARKNGADRAAIVKTADIPFAPELRGSCDQNTCGRFNSCWVGPPAIGTVDALIQQTQEFPAALVIQTIGQLEDSYDFEGMMAAKDAHNKVFRALRPVVHACFSGQKTLDLSCGCCDLCPACTYPADPCAQPEEAVSAVEAYGINVNPMLTACGLKYNNGQNTVSYVSLFFLPPDRCQELADQL
jgi:predicted metal-binding protein